MTSKILESVGKSYAGKHAAAFAPRDPVWETYTDASGKERRRKREIPLGLSKKEEKILKKLRKRANRLDKGFSLCGFRFGYTFILGLIPVVGDAADFVLGYTLIIKPAKRCDLPKSVVERMMFNQAVSTGLGFIPLAGDVFLAAWKTNSRNCALFEDFLVARAAKNMGQEGNAGAAPSELTAAEAKQLTDASKKKGYINRKTGEKASDVPDDAGGVAAAGSEYGASEPKRSKSLWSRKEKSGATPTAGTAPTAQQGSGSAARRGEDAMPGGPPARSGSFWNRNKKTA